MVFRSVFFKIMIVSLTLLAFFFSQMAAAKEDASPQVIAYQVKTESIEQKIKAIGHIQARDSINVSSSVSEFVRALHFRDGEWVRKGKLLVEFNTREQMALLEEAKVLEDEAKKQYDRVKEVVGIGSVTISLVDERYREWKTAAAKRRVIEAQIADRRIYAPFSGRLGFSQYSNGAYIPAGSTIVTLDDTRVMKLIVLVPNRFLTEVESGQKVSIQSGAFPNQSFSGEVTVIAPRLDANLRMVQLQISIPNPKNKLKPNMMVNAQIQLAPKKVLRIPNSAIQMIGDKAFVYRLKPNEINVHDVEKVTIRTGDRGFEKTEILSGLKDGDIIVSQGVMRMANTPRARIKGYENQTSQSELLKPQRIQKAP